MDISSLGITGVAVITVICFLVGQVVKATGLDNKWIPIICGVFGAVLPNSRRCWHRLRSCGHWYQSGL